MHSVVERKSRQGILHVESRRVGGKMAIGVGCWGARSARGARLPRLRVIIIQFKRLIRVLCCMQNIAHAYGLLAFYADC